MNVLINGFGRIGRAITRINEQCNKVSIVAINDINPHIDNMGYLLKYDSTYGKLNADIQSGEDFISINGKKIKYFCSPDISTLDLRAENVDLVIDATGVVENIQITRSLIESNVINKGIITNSTDQADIEIIMGVNDHLIGKNDHLISNSICDANAIAHVIKWLDDDFGIESGAITTLHPWLSYQNLVDGPAISQANPGVVWEDYALGRASSDSLIPKNTSAVVAVEKIIPKIKDKLLSFSYRVPTNIVASSDITLKITRHISTNELKNYLEHKASSSKYIRTNNESLISLDYEMEKASGVIDMQWVRSSHELIKIVLWYDNEWGYSNRVLDLAEHIYR